MNCGRIIAFLCTVLFGNATMSAEQLYHQQPSVTPELAMPGAYTVGVTTLTATSPNHLSAADFKTLQDRQLALEVWYPAKVSRSAEPASYKNVTRSHRAFELQGTAYRDAPIHTGEKFPLIVLSHGYTGYRTIMFYLGEHLASHGYVVAAIDHTDSTNAEVDMVAAPGAGFISTLFNRASDQQFVLDFLGSQDTKVREIVDTDNAALIGYSMGGYGAVNTIGGCYSFSAQSLQKFGVPAENATALVPLLNSCHGGRKQTDRRWKAMMAFSPWGGELDVHDAKSMQGISIPTLYVSGDQDDISGFENGVKKLHEQTGSKHNYLMVYENARHNIAAHPAPQVAFDNDLDIGHHYEPSWNIETINRINQHMSLAFFDCHLKNLAERCAYLPEREDITQVRDAIGKLTEAWPGFPDRWGSGVLFLRK
ncbi:MAG: acetylhydrolase [Halioglobus sp.]